MGFGIDNPANTCYNKPRCGQGVFIESDGLVVQLVRTLACHARGRGFEPHPGRQNAAMAQSVERVLGKDEVTSSNLVSSSKKE